MIRWPCSECDEMAMHIQNAIRWPCSECAKMAMFSQQRLGSHQCQDRCRPALGCAKPVMRGASRHPPEGRAAISQRQGLSSCTPSWGARAGRRRAAMGRRDHFEVSGYCSSVAGGRVSPPLTRRLSLAQEQRRRRRPCAGCCYSGPSRRML